MSKVEYDMYAEQIRREYSHYTEEEYCRGRIAVLQRFLKRERLYFTDQYYEKYEAIARRNIQGEINSLENGLYKPYSQWAMNLHLLYITVESTFREGRMLV